MQKLRRFADWSPDSDEYIILKQILGELVQVFIPCENGQSKHINIILMAILFLFINCQRVKNI